MDVYVVAISNYSDEIKQFTTQMKMRRGIYTIATEII